MSEQPVRDAVETHTNDFRLSEKLHDVRPHVTYELEFEGERAVCKLSTHPEGTAGLEGRLLAAVRERTTIPVPEILAVGDDHFVARWHEGVPDDPPAVTEHRVRAMGQGLATLHAETANWFETTGHLAVSDSAARRFVHDDDRCWGDTLLAFLDRRVRYLDSVGYGDVARDVRQWFRTNRTQFDGVDDAVLVHGNYLPEHVGLDGNVCAVIDFEHALVGSPEWDYVRAVLPMFGSNATHDVPESVFREAYESVRPLPSGFDDKRDAYVTLTLVSYLRSLHLQRGNRDSRQEVARRMRRLRALLTVHLEQVVRNCRTG